MNREEKIGAQVTAGVTKGATTIRDILKKSIQDGLMTLGVEHAEPALEHPDAIAHGDYSTNAALVYSKKIPGDVKMKPVDVAKKLVEYIEAHKPAEVEKVSVAGPGFVNFHLTKEFFTGSIADIVQAGAAFGSSDYFAKKGLKHVMIEYTDPNPFKEFHIGHLMSNTIGESIARIVEFSGAEVKRACYQGDVGLHVAKAVWGALHSAHMGSDVSTISYEVKDLGAYYAAGAKAYEENEQNKAEIIALNKKIYDKSDELVNAVYEAGRKTSLDYLEEMYKKLGTAFAYYFFESNVGALGVKLVEDGIQKDIFEKSDGAVVYKGDESLGLHTRVFINSQGLPTYEAKELGLVQAKYDAYKYDLSIVITGNEIKAYYKVLLDAIGKVYADATPAVKNIKHIPHGMLRLTTGKMSSRTGQVITAIGLIENLKTIEVLKITDEIAIGALKYSILRQGSGDDIIFDMEKSVSLQGDSGPYLQYATVRALSIIRKAEEAGISMANANARATSAEVSELERMLYRFGEVVEQCAIEFEPHYISTYLINVSALFNNYYAHNQIINKDDDLMPYRLMLTKAFTIVMENGLHLLGIKVPEKM